MPAENNLITANDLSKVQSIDFVNRFGQSVQELLDLLGITRQMELQRNGKIVMYRWEGSLADGSTPEGEDIPLTNVKRVPDREYTLELQKYRKAVSAEAIARVGRDMAIRQSDERVLRLIHKKLKGDFYAYLSLAPTTLTVNTLQQALAKAPALAGKFFDDAPRMVSLVNPMDVADWVGNGQIVSGQSTAFGFTLLQNFTSADHAVFSFYGVPEKTVYTTADENLVYAYLSMAGDLAEEFGLDTDETGLIGISTGEPQTRNATTEKLVMTGSAIFAEVLDAVVKTTIDKDAENPGQTVAVTGVTLNKDATSIAKDGTETLTASVAPPEATVKGVTWKSSNDGVATVAGGVVTGVSEGKATITLTTVDGAKQDTCEVTVTGAGV